MAATKRQPAARASSADEVLAQRRLVERLLSLARVALRRHPTIPPHDREDLVQDVAIAAFFATQPEDPGAQKALVLAIARNMACRYWRAGRRRIWCLTADGSLGEIEGPSGEGRTVAGDFLSKVGTSLTPDERRAVFLHVVEHQTLDDVAAALGITHTLATNRVRTGMAKLQRAVKKLRESDGVVIPPAFAVFFGVEPAAVDGSAEALERAWSRVAQHLGVRESPESEPPRSGTRPTDAGRREGEPTASNEHGALRAPARLPRLAGAALGILLTGAVVSRHVFVGQLEEPTRRDAAVDLMTVSPANVAPAVAANPGRGAVALDANAVASAAALPPPASRTAGRANASSRVEGADLDDAILVELAKSAIILGDLPTALALCVEHGQRFPHGQYAPDRERVWTEACSLYRQGRPQGDVSELKSCAGRTGAAAQPDDGASTGAP